MEVQVYEIEGTEAFEGEAPTQDQKDKLAQLSDKLGLPLQKRLYSQADGIPFPMMNDVAMRVWGEFCPHKMSPDRYTGEMPARVVELFSGCTDKKMFDRYEVWAETPDQMRVADPIFVGVIDGRFDMSRENAIEHPRPEGSYLIARWGDSLLEYADIIKQATENWIAKKTKNLEAKFGKLAKQEKELQGKLEQVTEGLTGLPEKAEEYFAEGDEVSDWVPRMTATQASFVGALRQHQSLRPPERLLGLGLSGLLGG